MTLLVSRGSISVDGKKPCSRCGRPRDRKGQRYCTECHAQYNRDRRAGKIEVLLTIEEWEAVKAARRRMGVSPGRAAGGQGKRSSDYRARHGSG